MVKVLVVLLATCVGMTAFVAWGRAAFPGLARAAERAAGGRASRAFWVGLANAIAAFLLLVAFGKGAETFKPLGVGIVLLVAGVALLVFRGALAVWPGLGQQVLGEDAAPSGLQATLAGGAVLAGSLFLVPAGFLFVGYALLRALGAGVLQFVSDEKPVAAPASPV